MGLCVRVSSCKSIFPVSTRRRLAALEISNMHIAVQTCRPPRAPGRCSVPQETKKKSERERERERSNAAASADDQTATSCWEIAALVGLWPATVATNDAALQRVCPTRVLLVLCLPAVCPAASADGDVRGRRPQRRTETGLSHALEASALEAEENKKRTKQEQEARGPQASRPLAYAHAHVDGGTAEPRRGHVAVDGW